MPVSIGVSFPESIMPGTPLPDIAGLAGLAEQAGLDGVWVDDRLAAGELSVLDSGLSLAVAAAATSSIAVGYAIFVPSLRPLAWAARQVATLQHIAGGRLQLGVAGGGGGDAIRLLPAVPVPPLWIGGTSPAALRRAVRFGDGWLSGLQTPREFAASRQRLLELSAQAGRPRPLTGIGVPADRAREVAIAGTPAQVASQLTPYVEAGADQIVEVCDPAPSPRSWELLADVRLLML